MKINWFQRSLLLLAALVVCSSAFGQTSYGTVAGTVTDSTGAAVPAATITIVSVDTHETRTLKSTANGGFRVESLGTGNYDISVESAGFSKEVIAGVVVAPSVTTSVAAVLKVGKISDTVEVSGANEILQTQSGEVSATIGKEEINDLPLSGLNAFNLATTLPGVLTVTTVANTNGPRFSDNGFRPRENNYLIEGQDDNDAGITGQGLQPANEEAADTVTFLLNSNPAEFGRGGGAVSNLVYRSGTNQYHGAVWDRLLNSSLNAFDHSATYLGTKKTKSRENIYGFRIGGPILKNKLFVFVSEQFDHYRASAILGTLVVPLTTPSASGATGLDGNPHNYQNLNSFKTQYAQVAKLLQAYAGISSPTALVNGALSRTDPNYREIALGNDPVTGADRGIIQFGSAQRTLGNIQNSSEFVAKGDYLISDKDKLQLRLVRSPFTTPYDVGNFPSQLPNLETDQHGISYNAGIVYNHTFTSHLFNELRMSYGRIGFLFDLTPGTYANPLLGPTVSISNITGFGIPTNTPQGRFHNTYQLQDGLSIVKGNHSMKVGFDIAQVRVRDAVPFVFYGSQSYIAQAGGYTALANFVDDYSGTTGPNTSSLTKYFGSNIARPTLTNQAYYAQDHWKAAKNLAIDAGLRYEYYGAPFNYLQYPAIDPGNLSCFPCAVKQKPNYHNFAPRVGFALTPFESGKTVVRGGVGFFYDNLFTNIADNLQASSPNAATPILYNVTTGRGTASWSTQFTGLNTSPLAANSVTSMIPNLRNPYTVQWNLAVEQQLPGAMSLTAAYIGSRSVHLYALDALNPTIPGTATRVGSTTRGTIAVHDNTGDGNYTGGTLDLQRKFRQNAVARIAYTYSKAIDDVSDDYTSGNYSAYPDTQLPFSSYRGQDRGPSAFDHRQRAILSSVYTIPVWHTDGIKKVVAAFSNNIQIGSIVSYQSGSVINVQIGQDWNGDGITNDRPVLSNPSAPIQTVSVLSTDYYTTAQGAAAGVYCDATYIANTAYGNFCHPVLPTATHFFLGNRYSNANAIIGRNSAYTRGTFQNDFQVGRSFKTFEHQDFLFRAECFDCMNHANTGIPSATLLSSANPPAASGITPTFFNYAPTASGGRTLRFFLRYEF